MFIVRSYYQITQLEKTAVPYGTELHRRVTEKYPELRSKTLQNILDQRRAIMMNKRLDPEILNRIRKEVAEELRLNQENAADNQEEIPEVVAPDHTVEDDVLKCFREAHIKYEHTDPILRPRLPKLNENPRTRTCINRLNEILLECSENIQTLEELHELIYIAAYTAITYNGQTIASEGSAKKTKPNKKPWQRRLERRIEQLRKDIGCLTQIYTTPNHSAKVKRKSEKIVADNKTESLKTPGEILELLKQKLAATSKRFKRYKKSEARRQDTALFEKSESLFYRKLQEGNIEEGQGKYPDKNAIVEFWGNIWSNNEAHRDGAWVQKIKKETRSIRTMTDNVINVNEVKQALKKAPNWKAPGPDGIQNYWIKQFTSIHPTMAKIYNNLFTNPDTMPDFMTQGSTVLIPKTKPAQENPSKYRPITCLSTFYKILTSIVADKIYKHLDSNNLLPEEQKGCRKKARGCKEQLLIDSVICENAKRKKQTLYTAYIDYKKAFDNVPHSWLLKVLDIYQVEEKTCKFIKTAMRKWKTKLIVQSNNQTMCAGEIPIQRGIFQGDSLSPLLFCMALIPLTTLLNLTKSGIPVTNTSQTKLSHLLFMDDLKLYATSKQQLKQLLDVTREFSKDIRMEFGLDKCKTQTMIKGLWGQDTGYEMGDEGTIEGMEEDELYKYLGYEQSRGIDQKHCKENLRTQYIKRLRQILRTELSGRKKIRAITAYAASVLTYSFGVINWTNTELHEIDTRTRVECTKHRIHHPRSCVERVHLPRNQGGRGIPEAYVQHARQVANLQKYFTEKANTSVIHQAIMALDKNLSPLNLAQLSPNPPTNPTNDQREKLTRWKAKQIHGKYPTIIADNNIDTNATHSWLTRLDLYAETEGFLVAIQDRIIATRNHQKYIMKLEIEDKCRMCGDEGETIEHVIGGCKALAARQYTERHDNVGKIIHQKLCAELGLETPSVPYYKYQPEKIIENDAHKILWDWEIPTDATIQHNRPDIIVHYKQDKKVLLIDIAIPLPTNIEKKNGEKIQKYLPLAEEVRKMWKLEKVEVVPIVVGATGEIPLKLKENLVKINLKPNTYLQLQKSTILDTCRLTRMVLGSQQQAGNEH